MIRKTKIRFTFAAVLLILVAGGYLLVDFIIGPPSRFDEFAASQAESLRRAKRMRRPEGFLAPAPVNQAPSGGITPEFRKMVERNGAKNKAFEALAKLDQELDQAIAAAAPGLLMGYTYTDLYGIPQTEVVRDASGALALTPEARERICKEIEMHFIEMHFAMRNNARLPRRDARSTTQAAAITALRVKLHQTLDKAEQILLTPEWAATTPLIHLQQYAPLAVQRAALRGAPSKAARLLQSILEVQRTAALEIFYPKDFQRLFMPKYTIYSRLQTALAQLARAGSFPSQAFDPARRILAAGHLGASQTADLLTEYAIRRRAEVQAYMSTQYTRINGWGSLLGGFPQYCFNALLAPRARREADDLIIAWTRNDPAAVDAAWRDYQKSMRRMNIDQNNDRAYALLAEMSHMDRGGVTPEEFLDVDFARLFLAAAHFRQTRGRLPESLAELIPNFADREFAAPIDGAWIVFPAPAIRAADPRVWNSPQAQDALKWQAQTQKSRTKKASSILEAFKDYPGDPKLAEWLHNGFLTLPERPVIGRLRPIPSSWTRAEASEFCRYTYSDSIKQYFESPHPRPPLYALTCAWPEWGDEETLLELLK